MLVGALGLSVTYLLLGCCYYFNYSGVVVLLLIVSVVAFYAFSLAPVVWVLLSEIFPNRIRGAAMAVGTVALWMGSFSITYVFPILNSTLGTSGIFWLYSSICLIGFLIVLQFLPETKGKTLEQIEHELVG